MQGGAYRVGFGMVFGPVFMILIRIVAGTNYGLRVFGGRSWVSAEYLQMTVHRRDLRNILQG